MPPLNDKRRKQLEAELAEEIGKVNGRSRRQLVSLLGNPPSLDNLTDDVWDSLIRDFQNVLTPNAEKIFIEASRLLADELGVMIDFSLVNQNAANWARQNARTQSGLIISKRREVLGEAVAQFYEGTLDRDGVINEVSKWFGVSKAEGIAVTEITRAAVEGERPVVEELSNQGVALQKVFVTVRDRKVCTTCQPMDGLKAVGLGFDAHYIHPEQGVIYYRPPLHTKCRCGERYEYVNEIIQ